MCSKRLRTRGKGCLRWAAGLTITEAVVASSLLLIAIVPILKALSAATFTHTRLERKTQSLALARGKLDEIRARCVHHYGDSYSQSSVSLGDSYLCNVSDDRDASLRLVTVAVGFDANADGVLATEEVEVTLATYIARRL